MFNQPARHLTECAFTLDTAPSADDHTERYRLFRAKWRLRRDAADVPAALAEREPSGGRSAEHGRRGGDEAWDDFLLLWHQYPYDWSPRVRDEQVQQAADLLGRPENSARRSLSLWEYTVRSRVHRVVNRFCDETVADETLMATVYELDDFSYACFLWCVPIVDDADEQQILAVRDLVTEAGDPPPVHFIPAPADEHRPPKVDESAVEAVRSEAKAQQAEAEKALHQALSQVEVERRRADHLAADAERKVRHASDAELRQLRAEVAALRAQVAGGGGGGAQPTTGGDARTRDVAQAPTLSPTLSSTDLTNAITSTVTAVMAATSSPARKELPGPTSFSVARVDSWGEYLDRMPDPIVFDALVTRLRTAWELPSRDPAFEELALSRGRGGSGGGRGRNRDVKADDKKDVKKGEKKLEFKSPASYKEEQRRALFDDLLRWLKLASETGNWRELLLDPMQAAVDAVRRSYLASRGGSVHNMRQEQYAREHAYDTVGIAAFRPRRRGNAGGDERQD